MDEFVFKSIKPTGSKVLTTANKVNEVTPGGIIMVSKKNAIDVIQTVIEIGNTCTWCKVGDKIMFDADLYLQRGKKWVTNPITNDSHEVDDNKYNIPVYNLTDKQVLMLEERTIVAVVEV